MFIVSKQSNGFHHITLICICNYTLYSSIPSFPCVPYDPFPLLQMFHFLSLVSFSFCFPITCVPLLSPLPVPHLPQDLFSSHDPISICPPQLSLSYTHTFKLRFYKWKKKLIVYIFPKVTDSFFIHKCMLKHLQCWGCLWLDREEFCDNEGWREREMVASSNRLVVKMLSSPFIKSFKNPIMSVSSPYLSYLIAILVSKEWWGI